MLLVPTLNRLAKLKNFCNSAIKTETTCPALIIADKKDYALNSEAYMDLELHHFPNSKWKIHITESVGMGAKIRETHGMWKDCAWVGVLNDDHVLITKEWDKRLIKQLDGTNFITCNDRWNAPKRAAGATMFSMPLVEAFGFPLFPPQIDHLGIDDVWEQIGKHTGCWEIDMSTVVEHHHVYQKLKQVQDLKNIEVVDDTHAKTYGRHVWHDSPEAKDTHERLSRFFKEDFAKVVERVKTLRGHDALYEIPKKDPIGDKAIPVST